MEWCGACGPWRRVKVKQAMMSQSHTRLIGPNCPGRAVQVEPMQRMLKAPGSKRWKEKCV